MNPTLLDSITVDLSIVDDPEAPEAEAIADELRDLITLAVNTMRERHPDISITIDGIE